MGHHIVLVSASFGVYLRPLAEALGIDGVVATELTVEDGRCTGALDGGNCRGIEKVIRLHAYLDARDGGRRRSSCGPTATRRATRAARRRRPRGVGHGRR